MPDLSTTDFSRINTQTLSAIKLQQGIVEDNVILRSKNSTEDRAIYNKMLANDDWIGITSIYGDAMLQSLYEAENSFPGGVLNNPAITQGQKAWLRNKYAKEEEQISDGSSVVNTSVAVTGGTVDFAAAFEEAKVNFPEGTDLTAPKFNSVKDVKAAIKAGTIESTDAYFVYTPDAGWEPQAKINTANFSPKNVADQDFLDFAKSIPVTRPEAEERFGVTDYDGLLIGKVKGKFNKLNIPLLKRFTKIVTSTTSGKEYTFNEYDVAFKSGQKARAVELGLPYNYTAWDKAEENPDYKVKYDLTPYTYSGDK